MKQGIAKVAAIGVLAAVPAVALADSTTYSDNSFDGPASIELKVSDGANSAVKSVVAKKLYFPNSAFCDSGPGRTGKVKVKGDWRVKGNGEFRVVGSFDGNGDPLAGGQLNVVGDVKGNKVVGDAKFTYGKTGCQTDKVDFKATK